MWSLYYWLCTIYFYRMHYRRLGNRVV